MIIPLYGIISHTRSMTQSRIRGILAGFNRGIKRPINLSAFTAHIRLNMDGLKYLVFHPSRVSPCLGSWAFQSLFSWNLLLMIEMVAGPEHVTWKFQSLFSWNLLLMVETRNADGDKESFQSLFSWNLLLMSKPRRRI